MPLSDGPNSEIPSAKYRDSVFSEKPRKSDSARLCVTTHSSETGEILIAILTPEKALEKVESEWNYSELPP